jgi:hypothetical protein
MGGIFGLLIGRLSGPISGFFTNRFMDYVDDVKQITAKWPDWAKQLTVFLLAAIIPALNAKFNTSVATCSANQAMADCMNTLLARPDVEYVVSLLVAFFLKSHKNQSQAKAAMARGAK